MTPDELWAKDTGETLVQHTLAVVEATRQVIFNLPEGVFDTHELARVLELCAAFHDTGKAATGFQAVLRGTQPDWHGRRHEVLSTAFAAGCQDLPDEGRLAILTHHRTLPTDGITGLKSSIPEEQLPGEEGGAWMRMAQEWEANRPAFRTFWQKVCEAINRPDLLHLADKSLQELGLDPAWLKRSGRKGQSKQLSFDMRERAALYRGLLITSDHMASGKITPRACPDLSSVSIYTGELRDFQHKCRQTVGNMILRAPTGSGKTEAALFWMQANWRRNSRVFYVLPYMASINAMHRRLSTVFGSEVVGVLHSKASAYLYSLRRDDVAPHEAQRQAQSLSSLAREMYFPVRVCTPHQILRYALRGRGWEQMLAEFPQACFIFDEVHAYDPQVTGLILGVAKLVSRWEARLLFTSATLPQFMKQLIQETVQVPDDNFIKPDPAKEKDRAILDKKRHTVELWMGNLMSRLDDILRQSENCPHTLIVCNHIGTAQKIFRRCQDHFGQGQAMLLHSRFTHRDRNAHERNLLARLPRILVATQVVEVSLDIDFYQAFFDPAPIDALAQRMGRVNRSGSRLPARIVVMGEQVSRHALYDAEITQRTVDELSRVSNPVSEDDLVSIANRVYQDGFRPEDQERFELALHHKDLEQIEDQLVAGIHQDWAEEALDQQDDRIEMLPACYEKKYKSLMKDGLWLEAVNLLVPVRAPSLKNPALVGCIDSSDEPWVIHRPYSSRTGLDLEIKNELD
jgi:CRISPR-associated endonuclease/helicase Cas3